MLFLQMSWVGAVEEARPASVPATELRLLTWPRYIDPEVVREFEQQFNATLTPSYFESDDARDDLLVNTDGRDYDIAVLNGPQFSVYRRRGWLAPVTEADIPNVSHIERRWLEADPDTIGYGVPYFWGTTGIAFRTDLVPEPITRWQQLFSPREALLGRIIMVNNARDVVGMALKALGHSLNSTDPEHLKAAETLLLAQKPYVKGYSYVSLGEQSELLDGRAWVAMMYNGDALALQARNPSIAYLVPEEGGEIWLDYLVVLASSPRQDLAKAFVNFVNEPPNAARNARYVHYATPNKTAEQWLPAEFLKDPCIYPSEEVLRRSEFHGELPPRAVKRINGIFSQLLQ